MTKIKTTPKKKEIKISYDKPVLKKYGSISKLTLSGVSAGAEGTGKGNFFKMD